MTPAESLKVAIKVTRQAAEFCAVGSKLESDYTEAAARLERLAPFMERLVAGVKDDDALAPRKEGT